MTKRFTAAGVTGIRTLESGLRISTHVTSGLKGTVGRSLEITLDAEDLAFLLGHIARTYPDAIRALARELNGYPGPQTGQAGYNFRRAQRLREIRALARELDGYPEAQTGQAGYDFHLAQRLRKAAAEAITAHQETP